MESRVEGCNADAWPSCFQVPQAVGGVGCEGPSRAPCPSVVHGEVSSGCPPPFSPTFPSAYPRGPRQDLGDLDAVEGGGGGAESWDACSRGLSPPPPKARLRSRSAHPSICRLVTLRCVLLIGPRERAPPRLGISRSLLKICSSRQRGLRARGAQGDRSLLL